jgi:hypothetical protein
VLLHPRLRPLGKEFVRDSLNQRRRHNYFKEHKLHQTKNLTKSVKFLAEISEKSQFSVSFLLDTEKAAL